MQAEVTAARGVIEAREAELLRQQAACRQSEVDGAARDLLVAQLRGRAEAAEAAAAAAAASNGDLQAVQFELEVRKRAGGGGGDRLSPSGAVRRLGQRITVFHVQHGVVK
jgi:hypothetical protein